MLGFSALGNLLQSYSMGLKYASGIFALFLLLLFLLKLLFFPKMILEDMKNPIMASVSGTLSMSLMLLSGYLRPTYTVFPYIVWILGVALHFALIVYFTIQFIFKLDIKKVFASYYIVYVGIVVASVTSPLFNAQQFGRVMFYFGLITFVALFILVSYRYIKYKTVPEPAKPLICIYAAPLSLCIVGYIQSFQTKSFAFLITMLVIAVAIYIFALVEAIICFKLQFYPSYAAFTFPFVISAIALKQSVAVSKALGHNLSSLSVVVTIETIIATVFVLYAFIRYMMNIFLRNN